MDKQNKVPAPLWLPALLFLITLCCTCLGIRYGSAKLSFAQTLFGLLHPLAQTPQSQIVWVVRLPHVAACLLAGAGLSVSGLLLQTATNNPLAGPNIIGVNAGAGFAMVLGLCLFPMAYPLLPAMAFVGAFACTMLIVGVSRRAGSSRVTIVLSGVAVSTLLSAATSLLKLLYPDLSIAYTHFSVGGVSGVTFADLGIPAALIALSFVIAVLFSRRLNLLCLGDSMVYSLGVQARTLRTLALLLASVCAGAAVSFAGLLGFVGLMVPHIGRTLTGGSDVRRLLPVCAMLGGCLVVLADLLGRVLFAPSEIPAGIITAFLGAPFFFVLLLQRRNRL